MGGGHGPPVPAGVAGPGLNTLGILINLTRRVGWTDVHIKPKVWGSDIGPHCIYFVLGYRCFFEEEAPHTYIQLLRWESYYLMKQNESVKWNLLPTSKENLGFIVFILYCDAVNFITISHFTCKHIDIKVSNGERTVLPAKLSVVEKTKFTSVENCKIFDYFEPS